MPGTWITALIFPFNKGLYTQGKLQIFVSARAGTFMQRDRLGSSNEINLLQLVPPGKSTAMDAEQAITR